jgi:hypothetical protein
MGKQMKEEGEAAGLFLSFPARPANKTKPTKHNSVPERIFRTSDEVEIIQQSGMVAKREIIYRKARKQTQVPMSLSSSSTSIFFPPQVNFIGAVDGGQSGRKEEKETERRNFSTVYRIHQYKY